MGSQASESLALVVFGRPAGRPVGEQSKLRLHLKLPLLPAQRYAIVSLSIREVVQFHGRKHENNDGDDNTNPRGGREEETRAPTILTR